jgi:hypothetical protein
MYNARARSICIMSLPYEFQSTHGGCAHAKRRSEVAKYVRDVVSLV